MSTLTMTVARVASGTVDQPVWHGGSALRRGNQGRNLGHDLADHQPWVVRGHQVHGSGHRDRRRRLLLGARPAHPQLDLCLLYTSDAADEEDSVDLGGRRIIK